MISSIVLMTVVLPMQIASYSGHERKVHPFFLVGTFIDCAQILGLSKFRLRDGSGNPYLANKAMMQEPLALVLASSQIAISEAEVSKRKKYIQSYVRK